MLFVPVGGGLAKVIVNAAESNVYAVVRTPSTYTNNPPDSTKNDCGIVNNVCDPLPLRKVSLAYQPV
jgi:hypothetical protein